MILAAAWLIASFAVAMMGRHRAFGFWGFFLSALLMTPIPPLLALILAKPDQSREGGPHG